jgi:hypothetical protein
VQDGSYITIPNWWLEAKTGMPPAPGGGDYDDGAYDYAIKEQSPGTDRSGKTWPDGSPVYVWQDWIAGTDPLDSSDLFHATIEIRDGKPVVLPSPDLGAERVYIVDGKETLDGSWGPTNACSHFFRVRVLLPDAD